MIRNEIKSQSLIKRLRRLTRVTVLAWFGVIALIVSSSAEQHKFAWLRTFSSSNGEYPLALFPNKDDTLLVVLQGIRNGIRYIAFQKLDDTGGTVWKRTVLKKKTGQVDNLKREAVRVNNDLIAIVEVLRHPSKRLAGKDKKIVYSDWLKVAQKLHYVSLVDINGNIRWQDKVATPPLSWTSRLISSDGAKFSIIWNANTWETSDKYFVSTFGSSVTGTTQKHEISTIPYSRIAFALPINDREFIAARRKHIPFRERKMLGLPPFRRDVRDSLILERIDHDSSKPKWRLRLDGWGFSALELLENPVGPPSIVAVRNPGHTKYSDTVIRGDRRIAKITTEGEIEWDLPFQSAIRGYASGWPKLLATADKLIMVGLLKTPLNRESEYGQVIRIGPKMRNIGITESSLSGQQIKSTVLTEIDTAYLIFSNVDGQGAFYLAGSKDTRTLGKQDYWVGKIMSP